MNWKDRIKILFGSTDFLNKEFQQYISSSSNKTFEESDAVGISTVYTCIKILAETISRLPVDIYQTTETAGRKKDRFDPLFKLLHYNANNYLTAQSFFSVIETHRNLKGNAFALIDRNEYTAEILSFTVIHPDTVAGYAVVNGELYYKIYLNGESNYTEVHASDLLHFKSGVTIDGIWGMTPIEALWRTLSTTYQATNFVNKYFQNGALSPLAIKSTIAGANQKAMVEAVEGFQKKYGGSAGAGRIMTLPPNTELQEVKMNLADAEFINILKFNQSQIASIYGVPEYLIAGAEASKYSNIEQTQISFKVNTISAIIRNYRQELEFKLLNEGARLSGKSIEFNTKALVETDYLTRIKGYEVLWRIAAISSEDIIKLEGGKLYEGADYHFVNGAYKPVELIGKESENI